MFLTNIFFNILVQYLKDVKSCAIYLCIKQVIGNLDDQKFTSVLRSGCSSFNKMHFLKKSNVFKDEIWTYK